MDTSTLKEYSYGDQWKFLKKIKRAGWEAQAGGL